MCLLEKPAVFPPAGCRRFRCEWPLAVSNVQAERGQDGSLRATDSVALSDGSDFSRRLDAGVFVASGRWP